MITKKRFALSAAIAAVLSAVMVTSTDAAMISWGLATNITGDADVSTNGASVGAFNVGDVGASPAIVNAVTFAGYPVGNGLGAVGTAMSSGVTFDLIGGPSGLASTDFLFGSLNTPFTALSGGYQSLLQSGTITNSPDDSIVLLLSGLTTNQQYEFQYFVNISIDGPPNTTTLSDFVGGTVDVVDNTTGIDGGLGQYVIGTFTVLAVDAGLQFIDFSSAGGAGNFAGINAFQLRAIGGSGGVIPEPGTALFGLALAGVCFSSRRRAREAGRVN